MQGEFKREDVKRRVGNYEDWLLHEKCTRFNVNGTKKEYKYDHGVEMYN